MKLDDETMQKIIKEINNGSRDIVFENPPTKEESVAESPNLKRCTFRVDLTGKMFVTPLIK